MGIKRLFRNVRNQFVSIKGAKNYVAVFLYHTVNKSVDPWTDGHRYVTPFAAFKDQIGFLQDNFELTSSEVAMNALKNPITLKKNLAVIHFDDGLRTYQDNVVPFLEERKIFSTMFLPYNMILGEIPVRNKLAYILNIQDRLGFVQKLIGEFPGLGTVDQISRLSTAQFLSWSKDIFDSKIETFIHMEFAKIWDSSRHPTPFMNEEECRALFNRPYVEIGSHTITHSILSQQDIALQREEILQGHSKLEALKGGKLGLFAYPFGGKKHFTKDSGKIVKELKNVTAFSTYGGINVNYDATDIKRITLTTHSPLDMKGEIFRSLKTL